MVKSSIIVVIIFVGIIIIIVIVINATAMKVGDIVIQRIEWIAMPLD